jgi:hypothetical protein
VRFEVVQGPKGQLAQNIAAIDEPDATLSPETPATVPSTSAP